MYTGTSEVYTGLRSKSTSTLVTLWLQQTLAHQAKGFFQAEETNGPQETKQGLKRMSGGPQEMKAPLSGFLNAAWGEAGRQDSS